MDINIWKISAITFIVVLIAKLISQKTKTVDVLWLILLGAILSNLGLFPSDNEIIRVIGEWGIVFILFALGFEEDLSRFVEGLKRSWIIAFIGATFPFLAGYGTALWLGYDQHSAIFWGLTMAATAVSLTLVSLKGENMQKAKATTAIMTAAIIDGVVSLIGVAIVIPLLLASAENTGQGFDPMILGLVALKVFFFIFITLFLGLIAFPERVPKSMPPNPTWLQKADFHISKIYKIFGIRKLLCAHEGDFSPLIMITIAMTIGAISHGLGFHPAIGAYFAGLFLHKDYFLFHEKEKSDQHFKQSKFVIDHLAFTIFGPIFFVHLGAQLIFDSEIFYKIIGPTLLLFSMVFVLQVLSAGLAARFFGKYAWHESVMIGLGMLGRAELAFIVIDMAFIETKIISTEQFYTLMLVTFFLNVSVPLMIKWWKPYYFGAKQLSLLGIQLNRSENVYDKDYGKK